VEKEYICVKSGNILERRERHFYWRGRFFSGLVDVKNNALYNDPEDSFAEHLGIESLDSLKSGLIKLCLKED